MAKKPGSEPLFVKSKVREFIKARECNTSSGVLDGDDLNNIIKNLLDKAINRAKKNNRKTVKSRDF